MGKGSLIALIAVIASCAVWFGPQSSAEAMSGRPHISGDLQHPYKENHAIYITMSDGVRLAADIWFPSEALSGKVVPAMVEFTRYWRAMETEPAMDQKPEEAKYFLKNGYAYVIVDVRGTGASFGTRKNEFSIAETRDFSEVISWIARQKWSNASVATIGISYSGNTAENATFDPSPALKAAVPRFTDFDWYTSLLYPGGLKNKIITSDWGIATRAMDLNNPSVFESKGNKQKFKIIGVKPVDADLDRKILAEAVMQHKKNASVDNIFASVEFRDDIAGGGNIKNGPGRDIVSPFQHMEDAARHAVPTYHWASWLDAGTANGVIARFSASPLGAKYVIGAWSHGAFTDANPYSAADAQLIPSFEEQYGSILQFLSPHMHGAAADGVRKKCDKELYYLVMGENRWKKTLVWPPKGSYTVRYYLSENGALSKTIPVQETGSDMYKVDFDFGTGKSTRWSTQMGGGDVDYSGITDWQDKLLTYASVPVAEDMEITGHIVVQLNMSSTTPDGQVIVYVQDVDPKGQARIIAEGGLRLIHRHISQETPPYPTFGPYHTYLRQDAMTMKSGQTEKVEFSLLPTSVLLKRGHVLRVLIGGHDKDTFVRLPEVGQPIYKIERSQSAPSFIDIPVVQDVDNEDMTKSANPFNATITCH